MPTATQTRLEEANFVAALREIHPALATWARDKIRHDGRTVAELKQRLAEIIEKAAR